MMPVFAVTRAGDQEPLLLIDARDEQQAVEHADNLDMIGILQANGYRPAAGTYNAVLATARQVARWNSGNLASMSGAGRRTPKRHDDAPAYIHFIAPRDFEPTDDQKSILPPHQRA